MGPPVTTARAEEQVYVSTLPGLETALEAECSALGWKPSLVEGGVELQGPTGLHQEANLRLRTASRVLLRLGSFHASDEGALIRGLRALDLSRTWDRGAPPRLSVTLHRAGVPSQGVVFSAASKAWGLAEVGRAGPLDDEGGPGLTLLVRVEGNDFTVSADTSGEPLHRRGYRQEVSRAPLRETLAAGILMLAGYDGTEPLVDPMCGSGTFLVEGAWMSMRRAPGLLHGFAFESFPGFDAGAWATRKARAEAETLTAPRAAVYGYDINAGSLGTARRNARRAGMTLALERKDLRTLTAPPGGPGLLVANPPYGKRLGEGEDLPGLYRALGTLVRKGFAGWRAALLVPEDSALVKALELPGARSLPVRNGGLRCRLLLTA
ncbi:RNA methyltransferase [Myxococcus llanfairpwllgwyngyllgogerychwyrndrobwllllantysiliogogogochensis]|uniref:RNA methyltransferase n=1 Tax=Myxococcus llanfairpwllgwyngyllgogerychwyrndrobwllllantysiliogogogochensis TaxID=2590453 RepID=A0A540WUH7_9BACT|nr:RNA methyltransferase [Myxococcus llanfairpwllgwyngyllgogerychwyrndrobwllllantysiliogogogochensis]TQF12577.1 RNA methyltransferase [Myxococcus llanfairpwllgwyngyllgogerychwyrndrobwllllantysiliogogogochensis]